MAQLTIQAKDIPDDLMGATLPLEIVPESGDPIWAMLQAGQAVLQLPEPGRYTVRARLPSGKFAVSSVQAESTLDAKTEISLGASKTVLGSRLTPPLASTKRAIKADAPNRVPSFQFESLQLSSSDTASSRPIRMEFGWWVGWRDFGVEMARCAVETLDTTLPGEAEIPFADNEWVSLQRRPLWALCDHPAVGSGHSLIAWPPKKDISHLSLRLDPEDSSPTAHVNLSDPRFDALFAYIRGGDLEAAQHVSHALVPFMEELLEEKFLNPTLAVVAAYALLKVAPTSKEDWVENLAGRFEQIPDGAIIHARHLARRDDPEAKRYFLTALSRGIPMFTEGIRLLQSSLRHLADLNPDDEELAHASEQANILSTLANPHSEVTSLSLRGRLEAAFTD